MDTGIELALHAANRSEAEAAKAKAFAEMARLEQLLSRSIPASDVNRVNEAAGAAAVRSRPRPLPSSRRALKFASLSNGAFDPTISPLLDRGDSWENSPGCLRRLRSRRPFSWWITGRLPSTAQRTVFLPVAGMGLDLGGIVPGLYRGQA